MKNILCFGDSNTFGYDTLKDTRFPWGVRWTSILQEKLGSDYRIIEEGMGAGPRFGMILSRICRVERHIYYRVWSLIDRWIW